MVILKLIHHQKAHTFQLRMFATYPNTIRNCAIKDRTASIRNSNHDHIKTERNFATINAARIAQRNTKKKTKQKIKKEGKVKNPRKIKERKNF